MSTEKTFDVMAMHCPLMSIEKPLMLVYCPLMPIEKRLMSVYCELSFDVHRKTFDVSILFFDL